MSAEGPADINQRVIGVTFPKLPPGWTAFALQAIHALGTHNRNDRPYLPLVLVVNCL